MIISKELEKLLDVETEISKFSGSILIKRMEMIFLNLATIMQIEES